MNVDEKKKNKTKKKRKKTITTEIRNTKIDGPIKFHRALNMVILCAVSYLLF